MIECIVNMLTRKFKIKKDEALIFYYDLCNRRKIEHFINHFNDFKTFDELKIYYLGGN